LTIDEIEVERFAARDLRLDFLGNSPGNAKFNANTNNALGV